MKYIIETEYGVTSKPSTSGNHVSNAVLERICHVLVNLVRAYNIYQTYVDKDDPWLVISAAAVFSIFSNKNRIKGCSPFQLIFCHVMILPREHTVDWGLILQQNYTQINNDNIHKIRYRVDHDYKVLDNIMLTKKTV